MWQKRNKYEWQMKNTKDIIGIIHVYISSEQLYICVKFDMSNISISGVIDV